MEVKKLAIVIFLIIIAVPIVFSTGDFYIPDEDNDYLIDNYDYYFKDQRTNYNYVELVNSLYNPNIDWNYNANGDISFKCLSYAASGIVDWHNLQKGMSLDSYNSFINGNLEIGTNPRMLENRYYYYHDLYESIKFTNLFNYNLFKEDEVLSLPYLEQKPLFSFIYREFISFPMKDPVTNEEIPLNLLGYSSIITNSKSGAIVDSTFPSWNYYYNSENLLNNYEVELINFDFESIKTALKRYGILYAMTEGKTNVDGFNVVIPIHAVTIIGYHEDFLNNYLIIHDNYGTENTEEFSKFRKIDINKIVQVIAFYDPSWPTYRHDNRRTGFTLLKGDMEQSEHRTLNKRALGMSDNQGFTRPSVAEIYGNDDINEIVTAYTDGTTPFLEITGTKDFSIELDSYTSLPPTIGDVNGDGQNDIIVSTGSSLSIFTIENGRLVKKMLPLLETKNNYCSEVGYQFHGYFGGTAISDIDNNGINNIISADETYLNCDAFLYNFEIDEDWNIIKQQTTSIGNVGVDLFSYLNNNLTKIRGAYL
jgi:hypothetical protein